MERKILAFVIAVVIGSLFLAACSSPQKDIIGKWKLNDRETIEFFADGTIQGIEMGTPFSGKYKFIGDEHIDLDSNGYPTDQKQFKVSGDELILRSTVFRYERKYQRVK